MPIADFHNTNLIDFITDGTGQTQKTDTVAVSVYDSGVYNGNILTPYTTLAQLFAAFNDTLVGYIGDRRLGSVSLGTTTIKNQTYVADTPRMVVFVVGVGTEYFFNVTFSGTHPTGVTKIFKYVGIVWEEGIKSPRLDHASCRYTFEKCIVYVGIKINITHSQSILQRKSNILTELTVAREKDILNIDYGYCLYMSYANFFETEIPYTITNSVFNSRTLVIITVGGPSSSTNPKNTISKSFFGVRQDISISQGAAYWGVSKATYYLANSYSDVLVDPNIITRISGNFITTETYNSLAEIRAVYPTAYAGCVEGVIGYLGDDGLGFFLLKRNSDIYKLTAFSSSVQRPGKLDYIIDSNTTGGTHNNTAFVAGRLTATASSGFYEKEIVLQGDGLENPIFYMARGLHSGSHTPTANAVPSPENPPKVTFMADYKVVGGDYTGVFHAFCWNERMGFDADGTYSGQSSFNPTTLVHLQIESIIFRIYVQQGSNTANTGIYGGYVAPYKENFCTQIKDQHGNGIAGVIVEAATSSMTVELITNDDGFTDFKYLTNINTLTLTVTDLRYFNTSLTSTKNNNYNFYELETRKAPWYKVRAIKESLESPFTSPTRLTA